MASARTKSAEDSNKASIAELCYYFDSVERDRIDQGQLGRKTSHILAIREKLMALPTPEFEAAIKTITRLVADVKPKDAFLANQELKKREALELFEKTSQANAAISTAALGKAQKIS